MNIPMKELNKMTFAAEVLDNANPVLVDFWAPWCGPCRMMGPVLEELAGEYEGKVEFCKVNVDDEGELAEKYGVVSIPSIMLFKNGEVVNRSVGAVPKAKIAEMLSE